MGDMTPPGQGTIAERLNFLIKARYPDGRGPSTYEEIAERSRQHAKRSGGSSISRQTVHNIHKGASKSPGSAKLQALATVFGVPVSYFLSDAAPTDLQSTPAPAPTTPAIAAIAVRLNHLFETVHYPPGRGSFSDEEVAEMARTKGFEVAETDLKALRTGTTADTSPEHLQAVAAVFGVPVDYFHDDAVAVKVSEELALLGALKGADARSVALRAVAGLDDAALQALVPVVEQLGKAGKRQRM